MLGQSQRRPWTFDIELTPHQRCTDHHDDDRHDDRCGSTAEKPGKPHREAETDGSQTQCTLTFGSTRVRRVVADGREHPDQAVRGDSGTGRRREQRESHPDLEDIDAEMVGQTSGDAAHDASAAASSIGGGSRACRSDRKRDRGDRRVAGCGWCVAGGVNGGIVDRVHASILARTGLPSHQGSP